MYINVHTHMCSIYIMYVPLHRCTHTHKHTCMHSHTSKHAHVIKVIRHAGVDCRMIILDDQARQQMTYHFKLSIKCDVLPVTGFIRHIATYNYSHLVACLTVQNESSYCAYSVHKMCTKHTNDKILDIFPKSGTYSEVFHQVQSVTFLWSLRMTENWQWEMPFVKHVRMYSMSSELLVSQLVVGE